MATLKMKDLKSMGKEEREKKMKELKFELIKSNANASKTGSKTKEIRKIIARIKTFDKTNK
ncbi:MAG: 50S ribosomal protein L29 [archaeon]